MKKFIYMFVTVLITFSAMLLSACKQEDTFYLKTKQLSTQFFENKEIAFIFSNQTKLEFNSKITTQINNGNKTYTELETLYLQTLKGLTYMYTKYNISLNLTPKSKTAATKKLYAEFEDKMQALETQALNVLAARNHFQQMVGNHPDAETAAPELNIFKSKYKNLLFAAVDFNNAFANVYTTAFLPYPTQQTTDILPGTEELVTTMAVGKLAIANTYYVFKTQDNATLKNYSTNLLSAIKQVTQLSNQVGSQVGEESTLTLETLKDFLKKESLFDAEYNNFVKATQIINLPELETAENKQEYLQQNNLTYYYNKVQRFLNQYINIYTQNLAQAFA